MEGDLNEIRGWIETGGLPEKISMAKRTIEKWLEHWDGMAYVAWSGGMDSTVLLDLVRQVEPTIPAVFCDTGQEYPEIRAFVRTVENVFWIKPARNFKEVLIEEGLPLVSKRVSRRVRRLQELKPGTENTVHLYLTGTNTAGVYDRNSKLPERWKFLVNSGVKISEKCCEELKKKPFRVYQKATGRMPFVGMRIAEGGERLILLHKPCNIFDRRGGRSTPIQHWNNKDVWDYVKLRDLDYCRALYDHGAKRTGCMFCAFGAHIEQKLGENRFERLKKSHPKQWSYYMDKLGMGGPIKMTGVRIGDELQDLVQYGTVC